MDIGFRMSPPASCTSMRSAGMVSPVATGTRTAFDTAPHFDIWYARHIKRIGAEGTACANGACALAWVASPPMQQMASMRNPLTTNLAA